jgi:hypothetical protein
LSLDFIIARLQDIFRGIYGQDINLDPDSQDGQLIAAEAEARSDILQLAEDIYNSFNPNSATGLPLKMMGALTGVTPILGQNSRIYAQVTFDRAGAPAVPAGSIIKDTVTGAKYALDASAGPSTVSELVFVTTATALEKGTPDSNEANAFSIETPVYGWASAAMRWGMIQSGVLAETDEAFRMRRAKSVAMPSQGLSDGLWAALNGLVEAHVFENSRSVWASAKGADMVLPPHSLAVVVASDHYDIAPTINRYILGPTTVGTTLVSVTDQQGEPHPVRYTIATPVPIVVQLRYLEVPGQGFSGNIGETALAPALATWFTKNQKLGADVVWGNMFAPILSAVPGRIPGQPSIIIKSLKLGRKGGSAAVWGDLAIAYNELATLAKGDVSLEVAT